MSDTFKELTQNIEILNKKKKWKSNTNSRTGKYNR